MKKLLIPLALAVALSGCFSFSNMFDSSRNYTLRVQDASVICDVGDMVTVVLDSNPTTGYQWTPASYNDMVLKIHSRNYVPSDAYDRLVGAGGTTKVSFEAIAAGESEIVLHYVRPWETAPANEARFTVTVRP